MGQITLEGRRFDLGHACLGYFCFNCFMMFIAHTNAVNAVSFHPSGNYLVSASSDTTLKVIPNICSYTSPNFFAPSGA